MGVVNEKPQPCQSRYGNSSPTNGPPPNRGEFYRFQQVARFWSFDNKPRLQKPGETLYRMTLSRLFEFRPFSRPQMS
jgi:hypothetical protein